jgi:hypothetical protein
LPFCVLRVADRQARIAPNTPVKSFSRGGQRPAVLAENDASPGLQELHEAGMDRRVQFTPGSARGCSNRVIPSPLPRFWCVGSAGHHPGRNRLRHVGLLMSQPGTNPETPQTSAAVAVE